MKGTILLLTALLIAGCGNNPPPSSPEVKPVVYVSIPPQAGLLEMLAGDRVEIRILVGEGQSPHSYEPTARQLAELGRAQSLFTMGVPFETALLNKVSSLYPNLQIVDTRKNIPLRLFPHEHHGEHCIHDHGEKDPHVWLSPTHSMAIATNMLQALENIDPENTKIYSGNHTDLISRLEQLHVEITDRLEPYKGHRFYVFHPSFGYFADQYGLEQVAVEIDGKAPSSRQLAAMISQAKQDQTKVVFVQKQFPANSAKAIAEAIDGQAVPLDPLARDIIANLRRIADAICKSYE
jgi:zinc transport system substrate-binding protein